MGGERGGECGKRRVDRFRGGGGGGRSIELFAFVFRFQLVDFGLAHLQTQTMEDRGQFVRFLTPWAQLDALGMLLFR